MTICVGVQDEESASVWIACDSYIGDADIVEMHPGPKWFTRGDLLFAYAGSVRAAQIVEHHAEFRVADAAESSARAYLIREVVPAIRRAYATHYDVVAGDDGECDGSALPKTDYLIAWRGQLCTLCDDLAVVPVSREQPYAAIGAASRYALGALGATAGRRPRDRVKTAVEVAARHSSDARGPAHVHRVRSEAKGKR